ncbi:MULTISPECIES: STAS domain-containing protein [Bacillaceae]|uniref:STAS domain-containing protein n=1 Tax=Bacillaceae TaxID=186817 RepID=UPI000BFC4CFD|nr:MULTISPECIES: STAS domain-containing protein [Bacillaceae]PGT74928.1 anti-anti-sigma factor [Bacillus sp. AFS040349]UGB33420.1 STAS domain-containing protein [Metabacillus sp. B2-18]
MVGNENINIKGLQFEWDVQKGTFQFEGQEAVLFWISTAMKSFFDTIEEISGAEASSLVFETSGFRQGLVVGDYFEKMKDLSVEEAAKSITSTYASAGWGQIEINDLNYETKTLTAHLKNTWEYKINVAQNKKQEGKFLPAHFAGIFTGLFGTNIWYEVVQQQLDGHEYSIINYYPSEISITQNIHQLARKKESEQIQQLEELVEEKTKELKDLVKQLSSPIIPVLEGIVVVPLIGKYEVDRAEELITNTLNNLPSHKASYLILDLTGLDNDISEQTASLIEKIGSASSLIGSKTILVGINPELSLIISQSGMNFSQFDCFQSLQHGIHFALGQMGRRIL